MVLIGTFSLKDALNYVQAEFDEPVYDAVFKPVSPVVTKTGERYLRESPSDQYRLLQRLGVSVQRHTKVWESIAFGIENAFLRGNKASPRLEVIVRVYEGLSGKVVQIIDQGEGFDYNGIVEKVNANDKFYAGSGRGLRAIRDSPVIAGYEGKGNIMNIVVLNRDLE